MQKKASAFSLALMIALPAGGATAGDSAVFAPGLVSTAEATEVRLAISPGGRHLLFGRIGAADDPRGWDIFESTFRDGAWTKPVPASFNSPANEFDPAFSPEGKTVLFFSNRPGGEGGDDLWQVALDPESGRYGEPVNLGPAINTAGDEWAPSISADGATLLFSSNGRGGHGGQDLFEAPRTDAGWGEPAPLAGVNTSADDFDAAYVGGYLVFSRGDVEAGPVKLFAARRGEGGWGDARLLPPAVNCSEAINNGPSASPAAPGRFTWSAACPEGLGRMDIFEADAALLSSVF